MRKSLFAGGLAVAPLLFAMACQNNSAPPVLTASTDALADHTTTAVQPYVSMGNVDCQDVFGSDVLTCQPTTIDPVVDGTTTISCDTDGNGSFDTSVTVTIDVMNTADGPIFDYTIMGDLLAAGVIVKGGPNSNVYDYITGMGAPGPQSSDVDLHSPLNTSNNKYYGLSHIEFCFVEAPQTGALAITKTMKDASTMSGESPLQGAEFTITAAGPDGMLGTADDIVYTDALVTDANGQDCVPDLPVDDAPYRIEETGVPQGFSGDVEAQTVNVLAEGDCTTDMSGAFVNATNLSFTNDPLANIGIAVESQVEGENGPAAIFSIQCQESAAVGVLCGADADCPTGHVCQGFTMGMSDGTCFLPSVPADGTPFDLDDDNDTGLVEGTDNPIDESYLDLKVVCDDGMGGDRACIYECVIVADP